MEKNSISPVLYLTYSLTIEPFDNEAAKLKKEIDLAEICVNCNVLKNKQVEEYFKYNGLPCPIVKANFIDTCYIEYEKNEHLIKILFYKILNSELLTPSYIQNEEFKITLTIFHRTILLNNNLLSDYDKYFNAELDNIIETIEKPRFYNLTNIYVDNSNQKKLLNKNNPNNLNNPNNPNDLTIFPLDMILRYKLFDYQKDNINWMIQLEKNPIEEYICSDKLLFFPDGRIYNYQENSFITNSDRELVPLKGGIILDDVGIGKTLQSLCLAMSNTLVNTLIVVPDHLESHWLNQFDKHFNISLPDFITIVKFSKFSHCKLNKYSRLIVDEIHELYSNNNYRDILELMFNTNCKYKWGITATPFPVPNSIYYLLRYLSEKEIYYVNFDRYRHFYDTYYKIFRKNTLKNIVKEIKLPNMTENNIMLEFNNHERMLYDTEIQAKQDCNEYFLRKCCCDVMINYNKNENTMTLKDFNNMVLKDCKDKFEVELDKLNKYIEFYNNCIRLYEKITIQHTNRSTTDIINDENNSEIYEILKKTNSKELFDNINHYKFKIKEQEAIVSNRKKSYEYLDNKINDTNKECPVCLGEITSGDKYDVPECGHICCYECMRYWLVLHSTCTICRKHINRDKMYTITDIEQVKLKYSTKIDKLLEILSSTPNPTDKVIIYTQFHDMIYKLVNVLNIEGIGNLIFEEPNQIDEFKNNIDKRVLILSSVKNASGIDLSFVSNIIIFEPIIGDTLYLKDIEKQIIGRIYRINQIKDINVYRFIIKDTIENEIFDKAKAL
jgi:SNF2 family DNA or RNA helicase